MLDRVLTWTIWGGAGLFLLVWALLVIAGQFDRLHARAEEFHGVLLTIEVDDEIHQVLELRRRHQLAQDRVAGQCELIVTPRGMTEPRILALTLLGRTLQNFKGCIVLTQTKLAVEARVLARCCYENVFRVGGLHSEGAAFADRMIEDDKAGRKGRVRFAFENETIFKGLSEEMQTAVAQSKQSFDGSPRAQFLKHKEISGLSAFKETYLIYSQFSGDAAHPTLAALARHWGPAGERLAYFDFIPAAKEDELDETLHLACMAVLGIMVVVNEMHGYTDAGKKLPALNGEFLALQAEQYGAATIAEGMEIRTEPLVK